jgi:SAM-dependent methyltransferase
MKKRDAAGEAFDALGELYDAEYDSKEDDLPFYRELAGCTGGPILELACGSGRILADLAEHSEPGWAPLWGLDTSTVQLARARRRLAGQPRAAAMMRRRRVRLGLADMRWFEAAVPGGFGLVILAFNAFLHLLESQDQLACLSCAARHLRPGSGRLAMDVFNPEAKDRLGLDVVSLAADFILPGTKQKVLRFSTCQADLARQRLRYTSIYDVQTNSGAVRRTVQEFELRYSYRYELEHLLTAAGLRLEAVWGGYSGEPYTGREELMVLVASRPQRPGRRRRRKL